jgi:uncharacterized protein (TIGR00266 family)
MKHEILCRPSYSALVLTLNKGEVIHAESGAMLAMDATAEMKGTMQGGAWKAIKRAVLTSESFFVTTITAQADNTRVDLAPRATGDLEAIELHGEDYVVQGGAFLASTEGITTDSKFTGLRGFMSGEGLFMIKASGTGTMFVSSFGGIVKREVAAGQKLIVDNGHLVAFPSSMTYEVQSVGSGTFGFVTTGEGMACVFTGPGVVYLQTRNLATFAETLNPFLPAREKSQGAGLLGQIMGG